MADELPQLEGQPATLANEEGLLTPPQLAELVGSKPEVAERIINLIESLEAFDYNDPAFQGRMVLPEMGLEDAESHRRSLFESLLKWLKELIANFTDELTVLDGYASWLVMSTKQLQSTSRVSSSSFGRKATFPVKTRVSNLCVRYKPVDTAPELLANLMRLNQAVRAYFGYKPLDSVPQVIGALNTPAQLPAAALQYSPENLARSGVFFDHPTNQNWSATFPMLDNVRLVIKRRATEDPLEQVKGLQIRLMPENITPLPMPAQFDFLAFNLSTSDRILQSVHDTAKLLAEQSSVSARGIRRAKLERLTQEIDRLKHKSDQTEVAETLAVLRQYVDWSVNPFSGFYGVAVRNLRAAYNVCWLNANL